MKIPAAASLLAVLAASACAASGPSAPGGLPPQGASPAALPAAARVLHSHVRITGRYAAGLPYYASIWGITDGADGRVWFTEFDGNKIGAITTTGTITQYPVATELQPDDFQRGLGSNMWTGGYGGMLRVLPDGTQTLLPIAHSQVLSITIGPGHYAWFADGGNKKVGRVIGASSVAEYPLPDNGSPYSVAAGADGNIWVNDFVNNRILKMSQAGVVLGSYKQGLTPGESLEYIIAAPDGNLYFTEYADSATLGDKIGRITTAGKITEIATLAIDTYPDHLALGKDGNVYFNEFSRKNLGQIDLKNGKVYEIPPPFDGLHDNGTASLVNGPDGRMWLGGYQTIYAVSY